MVSSVQARSQRNSVTQAPIPNWRPLMKSNIPISLRVLSLLLLFSGACALAQQNVPAHLSGLINDYSPSTVKGGPWEMHGQWTMDFRREWHGEWVTTADFLTDMTMSGYG